jgi:hypothetical protein
MMKPSKLTPYQPLIASWRKQGKSYREIVEMLRQNHGLSVGRNTVHSFVKVRSKRPRKVYTMLENSLAGYSSKNASHPTTAEMNRRKSLNSGNDTVAPQPKRFNYTYSLTYNLTRLTPEEIAALEQQSDDEPKGSS